MSEEKSSCLAGKIEVISITILLITTLVASAAIGSSAEAQENDEFVEKTEVIDCGEDGNIGGSVRADFSGTGYHIYAGAGIDLSGGYELPIEAIYRYPSEVNPGDDISVQIDLDGQQGNVWYDFLGEAEAGVSASGIFEFDWYDQYSVDGELINFEVPIGENQVQREVSEELTLAVWKEEVDPLIGDPQWAEVDLRLQLELELTWTSLVDGFVELTGDALENEVTEEATWETEEDKHTITSSVVDDAEEGDTISSALRDMTYNIGSLSLDVLRADLFVGWDTNVDLLPAPDPYLTEASFSFDDSPETSSNLANTVQDTNSLQHESGGIHLLELEDMEEEGQDMEFQIDVVEESIFDGNVIWIVGGIIITGAIIGIGVGYKKSKKQPSQQETWRDQPQQGTKYSSQSRGHSRSGRTPPPPSEQNQEAQYSSRSRGHSRSGRTPPPPSEQKQHNRSPSKDRDSSEKRTPPPPPPKE